MMEFITLIGLSFAIILFIGLIADTIDFFSGEDDSEGKF